jgi:phage FluMu protein Com
MLHELRCEKCGALLAKEDITIGDIEIKCHRCNCMNNYEYNSKFLDSITTSDLLMSY